MPRSEQEIVAELEQASDALQASIYACGVEYRRFVGLLRELNREELMHSLQLPIKAHMARAGLGSLIGADPSGSPGQLVDVVNHVLRKSGVTS